MLAQALERLDQELLVGDRMPYLHRRVPGGQHRQVVVVELVDRLRVMGLELVLGDLVDPCAHDLAQELAARFAADRLGHHADRFLRLDEAEGHRGPLLPVGSGDGTNPRYARHPTEKRCGSPPVARPIAVYPAVCGGVASRRAINSSSLSSSSPCPTASSSAAANSIRPLPSRHSSSVSRRPAWVEASRRMISSSRSTEDS